MLVLAEARSRCPKSFRLPIALISRRFSVSDDECDCVRPRTGRTFFGSLLRTGEDRRPPAAAPLRPVPLLNDKQTEKLQVHANADISKAAGKPFT